MRALNIGIVGLGFAGKMHIEEFLNCAMVTAVCATDPGHIQEALTLAPNARVHDTDQDLIHDPNVDAVVLATPNHMHVTQALMVLAAGKHLFIEKPFGITPAECEELIRAVDNSNCIVIVGHHFRYSPLFIELKTLIEAGEIGTPRMISCRELRGPFRKKSRDWISNSALSGGLLVEKGVHVFDLLSWLIDSNSTHVTAFGQVAVPKALDHAFPVNDHATVCFEFENGVIGGYQLCMFADRGSPELELEIFGENGSLAIDIGSNFILKTVAGSTTKHFLKSSSRDALLGYGAINRAFVGNVASRTSPFASPRNCLRGTMLAIAAEEAINRKSLTYVKGSFENGRALC